MKTIREILGSVSESSAPQHAYHGLSPEQRARLATLDVASYTGKVRDVVYLPGGDELLIVHSDRLTAFDKLISMVPYKGTILTAISEFWLKEAQKVVPTHYLGRPHERVLRTRRTTPIKAEVVVRGHLAGAMLRAYKEGTRDYCGAKLPDGLADYAELPRPILTPTTKAAAFEHDENASPAELVRQGVCTQEQWAEIETKAFALFAHGKKILAQNGWILVDTKYEFGRTGTGEIIVIDEVHTPDSSRFWLAQTYAERLARGEAPEMLDKETVRRYLLERGFKGEGPVPHVPVEQLVALAKLYLDVTEKLVGAPLRTDGTTPQHVAIESLL